MHTRAVIYARFSPRPNAKDCLSIETQVQHCREFAATHGLLVDAVYSDEAMSGKNMQRPGVQAALEHVARLKSKGVLVIYSLSRLARSTVEAIQTIDKINAAGANIVSLKDSIDTTTAMGRLMLTLTAALAQLERELIAERTSDGMVSLQANGRQMSYLAPYGYRADPTDPPREYDADGKAIRRKAHWLPDDGEQATLKRMIELHTQGHGSYSIARQLTSDGILFRGKVTWHHYTIQRILQRAGVWGKKSEKQI